jgi:S1-C subfamily serine protease
VVDNCSKVEIADGGNTVSAEIVDRNQYWDLALLKASVSDGHPVQFRSDPPPQLGENVVVAGYPLKGLLASDLQVTTGSVSALAGISNDNRMIQITAPIQSGNSGGPLFDESGVVIGVIVAKLNTIELARRTGDIAQNVNFAIKGELARRFLRKHNIGILTNNNSSARPTTEVASTARNSVVPVVCR